jgi:hypothetical protein
MGNMFKQMFLVGFIFALILVSIVSSVIFHFIECETEKIELVHDTKVVETNKNIIDTSNLIVKPVEPVKVFDTIKVYVYPKPVELKIEEPKLPPAPIIADTINLN